jgi:hypothetical protein
MELTARGRRRLEPASHIAIAYVKAFIWVEARIDERRSARMVVRVNLVFLGFLCSFLVMESRVMSKDSGKSSEDPLVITPGGPKPRDKVHTIKPGEHLQVNPDGTYSIVKDQNTDRKGTSSDADKIK